MPTEVIVGGAAILGFVLLVGGISFVKSKFQGKPKTPTA